MQTPYAARAAAVLALVLAASGCAGGALGGLGGLEDILGAGQGDELYAEIQGVDTRNRSIQVRTDDGRTGSVRYDANTVVVYQQRQYEVTALERGDVVVMEIQRDSRGEVYTDRIDVRESVQDRGGIGGTGQRQELSGRVGAIDHDRGLFQLQTGYSGTVTVSLPYNAPRSMENYFHGLRTGSSVRVEATRLGDGRYEVYRFL